MTLRTRPYVVTFEGLPGSGKTTLKNTLFPDRNDIDRIDQILPGDPQDDTSLTLDDIKRSDYLKTDRILRSASAVVLLDRYYHSTQAYQYAYDKLTGAQTFEALKEEYSIARSRGKLIEPDVTFYIDTPLQESYGRKNRLPGKELWLDPDFLKHTHKYYANFVDFHLIDGSKSFQEVASEIGGYISKNALPFSVN